MKLKQVTLETFRAIGRLELPLHPQLTVFVGENGVGKTSVLDGIVAGLEPIISYYPNVQHKSFFKPSDIRQVWLDGPAPFPLFALPKNPRGMGQSAAYCRIQLETTTGLVWDKTHLRDNTGTTKRAMPAEIGVTQLKEFIEPIIADWQQGGAKSLPIFIKYGVNRAVSEETEIQKDIKNLDIPDSPFAALSDAINGSISFSEAVKWFIDMENIEYRLKAGKQNWNFKFPFLQAIRNAIEGTLPNCTNFRTDYKHPHGLGEPYSFIVDYEAIPGQTEQLFLNQLSGGYKIMLALVMDIARRLGQANLFIDNPCDAEAIVLIDEVELHLHPRWQQHVLVDLIRVFPNVQFIVTTHSAPVLTTVRPENIVILRREDEGIAAYSAQSSYGADTNRVLSEILGVDPRPPTEYNEFTRILAEYWRLIEEDKGESDEAQAKRERLEALSAADPDLLYADMDIRRRRAIRQKRGAA